MLSDARQYGVERHCQARQTTMKAHTEIDDNQNDLDAGFKKERKDFNKKQQQQ